MDDFKNNLKKLLIIGGAIENKIKKSKINKITKVNKLKLKKPKPNLKSNPNVISGLVSGNLIKNNMIYPSPYDKPIKLDFNSQINLDDVFLEQTDTINFSYSYNKLDIEIDKLVQNISGYIGVVEKFEPNIYQDYLFTIDKENSDEIIFNNGNKFQIIVWNLELKKYFCLLWKLLEKLYIEFAQYKKNKLSQIEKQEILEIIKQDLLNGSVDKLFNNFENEINSLIILLLGIKDIFDLADDLKYLLSFDKINILIDKYLFITNFIINNLTIITN